MISLLHKKKINGFVCLPLNFKQASCTYSLLLLTIRAPSNKFCLLESFHQIRNHSFCNYLQLPKTKGSFLKNQKFQHRSFPDI